ncbi:MAG: sigma-70 family RNA polymerase sigma factor [Chthoniobacterales bacterium]|nr:sigma-70 family RNA polymerase sigma factor [Chthoniobacterales bacterium]
MSHPEEPDDRAVEIGLMERITRRERAAFEELYARYVNILYATALKFVREESDAQDVVQDVFIQVWDKAKMYDPSKGKPLTWVLALVRNRSIDRIRAIQRRARLRDEFEVETVTDESAWARESLSRVEAGEQGRTLRAAVNQLSPQQRKVIELAYFGGLTQIEVAEKLGEPLGTVKARARRGLLKLKEMIGPQL